MGTSGASDQPSTMSQYVNTYADNGGVHINSGIPNKIAIDNVLAFGVNCTSVKVIDGAVDKLIALSDKPLILYPNGGRKYEAVKKIWIDQHDASLVEAAVRWKDKGVKMIGGCCQVGPEEISELVRTLRT
ncbi:homocysteine S-methyltransferase family protein [Macrococcoides canis]|uniref:homocysteine S-methyltransferase family protein n=1 Tax=Macrococcoides canis TaxID=1855823 RepID=UPI0024419F5F|nr:homocysteine S-methyltransferase family protein [Macrococcus canis]